MFLLQIIMVSPGTHFVKNHESQLKKTRNPKLKMLWPLCNQTEDRIQKSILQNTKIKIKSFYFKAQKLRQKEIFIVKQQP